MIRNQHIKFVFIVFALLVAYGAIAQEGAPDENKREVLRDYRENIGVIFDNSWAFTFKYRTDGWQIGADYNKTINFFKSRVIQFDLGEIKHFKQSRQSKDPAGGLFVLTALDLLYMVSRIAFLLCMPIMEEDIYWQKELKKMV